MPRPADIPNFPYALLVRFPLIVLLSVMASVALGEVIGSDHYVISAMTSVLVPVAIVLGLVQLFAVPWGLLFAWKHRRHRDVRVQLSLVCGISYALWIAAVLSDNLFSHRA